MQKWEYTFVIMSAKYDKAKEAQLNALGEQGWELVAVMGSAMMGGIAFFKRPKS